MTRPPWRWLSGNALVGDHGSRPVILTVLRRAGHWCLAQRKANGLLDELDTKSDDARIIEQAAALFEALRSVKSLQLDCVRDGYRAPSTVCDCGTCATMREVNAVLDQLKGVAE